MKKLIPIQIDFGKWLLNEIENGTYNEDYGTIVAFLTGHTFNVVKRIKTLKDIKRCNNDFLFKDEVLNHQHFEWIPFEKDDFILNMKKLSNATKIQWIYTKQAKEINACKGCKMCKNNFISIRSKK
ncbi:MAG: hypothetical protein HGB12_12615 [Bacteroidetes bacterium]|nr:hypothetical protein [Bacteroidota bacterium]